MATFVILANFTEQGIKGVKDTAVRAKNFRDTAAGMGVKIKDIYWTFGTYDVIVTMEAPKDEDAAALMFKMVGLGNLKSPTPRALAESEISALTSRL